MDGLKMFHRNAWTRMKVNISLGGLRVPQPQLDIVNRMIRDIRLDHDSWPTQMELQMKMSGASHSNFN